MKTDAHYATLARSLGLTAYDLAEVAGCSFEEAHALSTGGGRWSDRLRSALDDLFFDSTALVDTIIADAATAPHVIRVFRTNEELRTYFPDLPGRGYAAGAFVGPYSVAALDAKGQMFAEGIDLPLQFHGEAYE